jgi:hypothetical protein
MIGLDKYMTFTTQYSTRYDWQNNLAAGDLGKSSRWGNSFSVNPDINLKPIADAIWKSPSQQYQIPDTAKGVNPLKALGQLSKILIKVPFFDFERIGVTFSQTNTSQNTGVLGRTGFMNLFGRVPFFQSSLVEYGPSFWYQMGLSGDPHGELKFRTQSKFPFFQGFIVPGPRAKNGNLVDVFSQQNRMTARTSRPLWEGVRLDLNWSLGNSVTINRTVTTDSLGTLFERNRTVSGDIDRSFVTFPNTFIFKMFKTSIEEVNKKFQAKKSNRSDTRSEDQK